jgi:hypothetical protein
MGKNSKGRGGGHLKINDLSNLSTGLSLHFSKKQNNEVQVRNLVINDPIA